MDASVFQLGTAIERSDIDTLDILITELRQVRNSLFDSNPESSNQSVVNGSYANSPPQLPRMCVYKDCIPRVLRHRASALLGIEFGESPCYMVMTALQLSVLIQYTSMSADEEKRAKVVEMLVKESSVEDINGNFIGDRCNVLHLAAFLNLKPTMQLLINHGGDPSIENGFGLNADDIMQAVPTLGLQTMEVMEPKARDEREW
ncbi:hypothetical protein BGZ65_010285 [Modicella reniformis]|uniref:Uncharacterized protein n=1 Tax=Modicella reniformis TaxID=1440133 RepID=A0A9P6SP63_9FUNG|nr:hypothetical protein BGZ65_010285 [Modicella reniformis]